MKKNKYVGICKVGEKGQIVIPKDARVMFNIKPGDSIIVLCDKDKGIALVKSDVIENISDDILVGKKWFNKKYSIDIKMYENYKKCIVYLNQEEQEYLIN